MVVMISLLAKMLESYWKGKDNSSTPFSNGLNQSENVFVHKHIE